MKNKDFKKIFRFSLIAVLFIAGVFILVQIFMNSKPEFSLNKYDYHELKQEDNIPGTDWTLKVSQICDFHSSVYFENSDEIFNLGEINNPGPSGYKLRYTDFEINDALYIMTVTVNKGDGGGFYFRVYKVNPDKIERLGPDYIYSCVEPEFNNNTLKFKNYGNRCSGLFRKFQGEIETEEVMLK